jgi:hypothetical protein
MPVRTIPIGDLKSEPPRTGPTSIHNCRSTPSLTMTTSRKKKSSSSLHISRPYAQQARTIRVHRNANNRITGSASHSTLSVASSAVAGLSLEPLFSPQQDSVDDSMNRYDVIQPDPPDLADGDHDRELESTEKSKRRTRTKPLVEWSAYRDVYLQEMFRHDGREGLQETICAECGKGGEFTCSDCAYRLHYCKQCMVDRHRLMPFHRVKV